MQRFQPAFALSTLLTVSAAVSTTCLTACGGDDDAGGGGKGAEVTDANTVTGAQNTGEASKALTTIQPGNDAATAQGPVMQVGGAMSNLANTHLGAKRTAKAAAGLTAVQSALETAISAQVKENVLEYDAETHHLSANLAYDSAGVSWSYVVELDLPPTADGGRRIDGTFDLNYDVANPQYTVDYSINGQYDGFTVDAAGCATAGSIRVDYSLAVSGSFLDQLPADQRAAVQEQAGGSGTVTIEFGPACGDLKVFGR
jgi:hypothetical protein